MNTAETTTTVGEFEPMTLGELVAEKARIGAEKTAAAALEKRLGAQIDAIDAQIMAKLDELKVEGTKAAGYNITISKQTLPNAENWDAVYEYIKDNDAFYLLQKRFATTAYAELRAGGTEIPGVVDYEKRSISMRKA